MRWNHIRSGAVVAVCALLAACSPPRKAPTPSAEAQSIDLSLKDFMGHVVHPNAMRMWDWQAYVSDAKGSRSTLPSTDEEWEQAESAALTVAELTVSLDQSPRRREGGTWTSRVLEMRTAARAAARAAEAHESDAFTRAGERLEASCRNCHYAYAPHLEATPQ